MRFAKRLRSIRHIQGILSFARKYSSKDIDQAAAICLENKLSGYRAVKNILEHKVATAQEPGVKLTQNHECIRPTAFYNSLWNQRTQTKETTCL